jgi:hypothetical protein
MAKMHMTLLLDPLWHDVILQSHKDIIFANQLTELNKSQMIIAHGKLALHFSDEVLRFYYESKERYGNYKKIDMETLMGRGG